jgi:peptide/nickel transport system substrate-binding protein
MRNGNFYVTTEDNCPNVVNPLTDVGKYLPHSVSGSNYGQFDDPKEIEMYNKQLHELDESKERGDLLKFNKYVLDEQARAIYLLWWQRIVPYRSYVKGWRMGPSHYDNQALATIWLDK